MVTKRPISHWLKAGFVKTNKERVRKECTEFLIRLAEAQRSLG